MQLAKFLAIFWGFGAMLSCAHANPLVDCVNSLVAMNGSVLYVRPGLPAKPAGDALRQWTRVPPPAACQSIDVVDVVFKLQDARVDGMQMTLASGQEKLLFLLDPAVQTAISTQLARAPELSAMHPISIFKGDRSGFNYVVKYQKNVYTETLSWGSVVWGAQSER